MDSWRVSACYPRRTFYPLSDGPSTQNHRITMTVFRLCSTCQSRSQAGLCHCTLRTISDRSEPTRTPVTFGRRIVSQTTPIQWLPDYGKQLMSRIIRRTMMTVLADAKTSKSPSYAKHIIPNTNIKL